ncbi:uncharacterized protein LOC133891584 [Phragmites australis]|uniref:uncharacterized protein LOC133891584 n=1 Tax=Phragmites australis TaxID=29695 RepID=UPI002D770353|nr:uncharacterized protein LOC133891584 [Phragmites australis]
MVVLAVGGGCGAGAGAGGWGTWEELVLGGAVLRHGGAAWAAVADELRSRSPCAFSPEECETKFAEIQSRYSACNAWFEELRKQRVAQLKRELEKSKNSIGSLQSVIESLSNSKHGDGSSECRTSHTESCSPSENTADTNSSSKELSRDRSSEASFTEEASNCQKSQQLQRCDTDSIQANNTSPEESFLKAQVEKVCTKDSLLWGSRKQRGARVRKILPKGDDSSRDGEPTSTACIEREGSSGGCMKDLKTPNVEYGAMKKGLKTPNVESGVTKKGLKTTNVESGVMKNSLKTPKVECGVSVIEREKLNLAEILKTISTQGDCLMLQRQVDTQRKGARYKKMIRQHMDFRILHSKIKSGAISSTQELLRDMLLFVSNVLAFYPKATLEHMAAVELRDLASKTVKQSASFVSQSRGATGTANAPVAKKNVRALQPGRHGPGDAKGSNVSSRDATSKQGEGKDSRNDASLAANVKTVRKSEPAKKRGVGRPPKSGPPKRSAGAQEDGLSKGKKRIRR